ncbi:hypothetical protein B9Z55_003840 [Caenorhabditis nigoni]|uniref:Uncharacterized protein n=1 Tax=Caenorhabditis nigoni TaxID=1611254 RepID=A0A2G5VSD6_9PELO|nr:hypothetical protein B9Z55_003840 [Caenorhabditis nigoni]
MPKDLIKRRNVNSPIKFHPYPRHQETGLDIDGVEIPDDDIMEIKISDNDVPHSEAMDLIFPESLWAELEESEGASGSENLEMTNSTEIQKKGDSEDAMEISAKDDLAKSSTERPSHLLEEGEYEEGQSLTELFQKYGMVDDEFDEDCQMPPNVTCDWDPFEIKSDNKKSQSLMQKLQFDRIREREERREENYWD